MLFVTLAALGLAGLPAEPKEYRLDQVSSRLKAGCKVWSVHLPAGKIGSPRMIVRCPSSKAVTDTRRDSGE